MTLKLTTLWGNASWREAARVRAAEVDLDHLYLGLLAIGGSAAQLLGRRGITLTSARRRAREAMQEDLARLGLTDADDVLPPPLSIKDLGEGDWRPAPRTKELLDEVGKAPDTYALLVALLQEPSGTVRRLVAADGVVPQDLVPELKAGADDPYSAEGVPVIPGLLPGPARASRVRHFVPAPPEAVADALSDPAILALWAYAPEQATVDAAGTTVRYERGRKSMTVRHRVSRARESDAEVVTWVADMLDTRYAGQPLSYDRFEARPAPGGTELALTRGRRTFGVLGALIAPIVGLFNGWGMLHSMQVLAFVIADRQDA